MAGEDTLGQEDGHTRRIFHIGVTGHRAGNAPFDANREAIDSAIGALLKAAQGALGDCAGSGPPDLRVVTNLANGSDLMAARAARDLGMGVLAPLPFGKQLNRAFNVLAHDWSLMHAVASGQAPEAPDEQANLSQLDEAMAHAQCFELAEQDAVLARWLARFDAADPTAREQQEFANHLSNRTRAAGRITIEQSDVLLAIWDGAATSAIGGTRDTMAEALAAGVPVIWLDARAPDCLHWLDDPADLAVAIERDAVSDRSAILGDLCTMARENWAATEEADAHLHAEHWRDHSRRRFHAYRRIEALFAGEAGRLRSLRQVYEKPGSVIEGSAAPMLAAAEALPGADVDANRRMARAILPGFALADGISTYLSDAYRGGMVANFLLSAAAIIAGVAYLPLVSSEAKWPFALTELVLLLMIVAVTVSGLKRHWHRRWFRTRRVAEYLRAGPIMHGLGTLRAKGHWPVSRKKQWPELHARQMLLATGLPQVRVTAAYLRQHLRTILRPYLVQQRDYHRAKASRLERVHHNLDRFSEVLFLLAIVSVGTYLALKAGSALDLWPASLPSAISKATTFMGVAFPTLGAAIAGIRYFADYERFSVISDVSAEKLDRLVRRADMLLASAQTEADYTDFSDLAHAMNDVVIDEIESWQAIFGTKKMAVPV